MLVFTSHVTYPAPSRCPGGEAVDGVEPLLVRPSKIVRDRLSKMIAIRQRWVGNACKARIERFNTGGCVTSAIEQRQFTGEFPR